MSTGVMELDIHIWLAFSSAQTAQQLHLHKGQDSHSFLTPFLYMGITRIEFYFIHSIGL